MRAIQSAEMQKPGQGPGRYIGVGSPEDHSWLLDPPKIQTPRQRENEVFANSEALLVSGRLRSGETWRTHVRKNPCERD